MTSIIDDAFDTVADVGDFLGEVFKDELQTLPRLAKISSVVSPHIAVAEQAMTGDNQYARYLSGRDNAIHDAAVAASYLVPGALSMKGLSKGYQAAKFTGKMVKSGHKTAKLTRQATAARTAGNRATAARLAKQAASSQATRAANKAAAQRAAASAHRYGVAGAVTSAPQDVDTVNNVISYTNKKAKRRREYRSSIPE